MKPIDDKNPKKMKIEYDFEIMLISLKRARNFWMMVLAIISKKYFFKMVAGSLSESYVKTLLRGFNHFIGERWW